MTCIVGYIDKNKNLWMGADSLGTTSSTHIERKDVKLFENKDFLIGFSTSFRMGQILRFKWNPPVQMKESDYEFMCTKVVDSIRDCLRINGYTQITNNRESIGQFLIGYKNRLYKIDTDFQVAEHIDNFISCGSGEDFALGAFNILKNMDLSAKQICKKALETAEKFNPSVGKPFVIKKYKYRTKKETING